jgi:hypothetical protein
MSIPHQRVSKLSIEAQKLLKDYFLVQEGFSALENYVDICSPYSPIGRQWRKLHEQQKSILENLAKMGVAGYYEWYTKDFTEDERRVCDMANEMNLSLCRVEANGTQGWRLLKHVDQSAEPLFGSNRDSKTLDEIEEFLKEYKP